MANVLDPVPAVRLVVAVTPQRGFYRLTDGTRDSEPSAPPAPATFPGLFLGV